MSRTPSSSTRIPTRRPRLATALAVVTVLAVAAAAAFLWWLLGESQDDERRAGDEVAVTQAAERFVETWNTFTPEDVEEYVERVEPLLSTKFRADFTASSADVVRGIEAQQLSSEGEVLVDEDGIPLVGIASLDETTAEVLVVADALRVANGQEVIRHWRWQVTLVEVDGEWLVDEFTEVGGEAR